MDLGAAHVLEVLDIRGMLPKDRLAVCVVGSRTRPWANGLSDWDVYVVTRFAWHSATAQTRPIPLRPGRVATEAFFVDQVQWEVTYWRQAQVDQMLEKVSWEEFGRGSWVADVLTLREEIFLSRLADAVAVSGDAWLARHRMLLGCTAFRSFLLSRSLGRASDAVEDALGQLAAGDLESATLSARNALQHTTDALLESLGEYGTTTAKWKPQRFRAAAPAALTFERYWALDTMRSFDPDDPAAWVEEVLTACQDVTLKVENP